jgi:hypothetical protein
MNPDKKKLLSFATQMSGKVKESLKIITKLHNSSEGQHEQLDDIEEEMVNLGTDKVSTVASELLDVAGDDKEFRGRVNSLLGELGTYAVIM